MKKNKTSVWENLALSLAVAGIFTAGFFVVVSIYATDMIFNPIADILFIVIMLASLFFYMLKIRLGLRKWIRRFLLAVILVNYALLGAIFAFLILLALA